MDDSGLNLYSGFSGVEKAPSISSTATWLRVPGLWSRRWPVAGAHAGELALERFDLADAAALAVAVR